MDKQEIQMRLSACRPSGLDRNDAAIRQALEQLPGDPKTAVWFARSQALDFAICRQLESVEAPDGLKERILAGARLNERKREWNRRLWLAAAAVVMAGVAVWSAEKFATPALQAGGAVASLREYRDDVTSAFLKLHTEGFDLDMQDADVAKVKAWLAAHGAPGDAELRPGLGDALPFGCKIIEWRGQRVSMMCFGKNSDEAHLFVVNRSAIRDLGNLETGRIERVRGLQVITWQDDKRAYVMVGNSPETDLKEFL
jgi:hypothetical protein